MGHCRVSGGEVAGVVQMTPRPGAARRLQAWNEGASPLDEYRPESLDFQLDLRWVLEELREVGEEAKRLVNQYSALRRIISGMQKITGQP